jgi:hypothetical protein
MPFLQAVRVEWSTSGADAPGDEERYRQLHAQQAKSDQGWFHLMLSPWQGMMGPCCAAQVVLPVLNVTSRRHLRKCAPLSDKWGGR